METLVFEDSPLNDYLEGRGEAPDQQATTEHGGSSPANAPNFAPPANSMQKLRRPRAIVRPILKSDVVSRLRRVYAAVVNSTLGSNDNERFLEHFRYQIIASQLLSEDAGSLTTPSAPHDHAPARSPLPELAATTTGAAAAFVIPFLLVWIWQWARGAGTTASSGRALIAACSTLILLACIWLYTTRRSLLYLRRNVIDATSAFTTNLQSLSSSSSSVLSLIQEVELVSRGYRISQPLPPITRLDGADQPRKAIRLRRSLQQTFSNLIPALVQSVEELRPLVDQDDVERFLDVYEVRGEDIKDALLGSDSLDENDVESLRSLKMHQARYSTLRRLMLCSLLSLQATGRRADTSKWQLATKCMETLGAMSGDNAQVLIKLLDNEEQPPTPVVSRRRTIGSRDQSVQHSRVESQVRRISTLSTGIRSLQAKLYLLREESARALSGSTSEQELSQVTSSLREQYESLGTDLQGLMQAWEAGKQALNRDITRQERRVSQPNSPDPSRLSHRPYSPEPSLACVNETRSTDLTLPLHGPGRAPLSPPVTDDGSDDLSVDDEVFEAISSPRVRERSTLSREERIAKAREERERLSMAREKRDASTNMVKELQSVIKLRPLARNRRLDAHERVTSF